MMLRNIAIGLVAGAVAVVALVFSRPRMLSTELPDPAPVKTDAPAPPPWEPQAWEKGLPPATVPASLPATPASPLDRVVDEMKFDATPLAQGLETFARKLGVSIVVNWTALEGIGIEKQTPVTMSMQQAPARRALEALLAIDSGRVTAGYRWQDGVLAISTREDLDKYTVMRVYDIRDLLAEAARTHRALTPDPAVATGLPSDAELAQQVTAVIVDSVQPESWRDAGGTIGSLKYWAGRLVITQTPENHEKVEAVLRRLRGSGGR